MSKIIILDENTSNKIAAGEVVERPASIVKELVENSLDAEATSITVEIKNGGITFIKVMDNGSGMEEGDVIIAFERHATSKIKSSDDLRAVSTMGFRGEALASIAAVSNIELTSRTKDSTYGSYVKLSGGTVVENSHRGCPVGTTIIVRDLFFNTPARYKFLKKDSTEGSYIADILNRIALGNPHVSLKLINNGNIVLHTPGNNDLLSTIFCIYGRDISNKSIKIDYTEDNIRVTGYVGSPEIARSNRSYQTVFVNGRYIKNRTITSAIDEAYKTLLMKNKYAFVVLNIDINPALVDVNVHPAKTEVRFSNEQSIFRIIYHAIKDALMKNTLIRNAELVESEKPLEKTYTDKYPDNYIEEYIVKDNFKKRNISKNEFRENDYIQGTIDIKSHMVTNRTFNEEPGQTQVNDTEEVHTLTKNSETALDELLDSRIIGQAFSTYILLEYNQELILIDQHAAHERIIYEDLLKKYHNSDTFAQTLLSPITIELTPAEMMLLDTERDFFSKIGFIFENFGNNSIVLRAVPYINSQDDYKSLFLDMIDVAKDADRQNYAKIAEEALYMMACKAAVKANKKLDNLEIKSLLKDIASLDNPYSCPHGRPTMIKITMYELEKRFKRIV